MRVTRLGPTWSPNISTLSSSLIVPVGNKAAAAKGGGALLIPRYFSLERLLSIYAQIVGIVEGRKPVGYGTVSIYATVSSPCCETGNLASSVTLSVLCSV